MKHIPNIIFTGVVAVLIAFGIHASAEPQLTATGNMLNLHSPAEDEATELSLLYSPDGINWQIIWQGPAEDVSIAAPYAGYYKVRNDRQMSSTTIKTK